MRIFLLRRDSIDNLFPTNFDWVSSDLINIFDCLRCHHVCCHNRWFLFVLNNRISDDCQLVITATCWHKIFIELLIVVCMPLVRGALSPIFALILYIFLKLRFTSITCNRLLVLLQFLAFSFSNTSFEHIILKSLPSIWIYPFDLDCFILLVTSRTAKLISTTIFYSLNGWVNSILWRILHVDGRVHHFVYSFSMMLLLWVLISFLP